MGSTPPSVQGPVFQTGDVDYKNSDGSLGKEVAFKWFELSYNGFKLKYTVTILGQQPTTGYPVFIGLHGGREEALPGLINNGEWVSCSLRYFRSTLDAQRLPGGAFENEGVMLIVPRGVTKTNGDSYYLHSEPESYVLMEALIADLLQKNPQPVMDKANMVDQKSNPNALSLIDVDRVFLTGYSAGGDGAFQLSQRISDRFAAVNAGAGHPNYTTFKNLANLPICLQVGEKDIYYGGDNNPKRRAEVYVDTNFALDTLRNNGEYYFHDCYVVRGAAHTDPWHGPGGNDKSQPVLSNLAAWAKNHDSPDGQAVYNPFININPIRWLSKTNSKTNYKRNTIPKRVVWDLGTRPNRPENLSDTPIINQPGYQPKRFSYWLYLRDAKANNDTLEAEYGRDGTRDWINFKTPQTYLAIMLREDMVNFANDLEVRVGGQPTGTLLKLVASQRIRDETLAARKDPRLVFSAAVYLDQVKGNWVPRLANSLITIDPAYKPYQNRLLATGTVFGVINDGPFTLADPFNDGTQSLILIKTRNTSSLVEIYAATQRDNYQRLYPQIFQTAFSKTDSDNGTWLMRDVTGNGRADLVFIKTRNTPRKVEVHVADAGSGYKQFVLQQETYFDPQDFGVWTMTAKGDLVYIKTRNTGGRTEIYIASKSSNYKELVVQQSTTFAAEENGTWCVSPRVDGNYPDLYYIKNRNVSQVEVHVASALSNWQDRVIEVISGFAPEDNGTWLMSNFTKSRWPDLTYIKQRNVQSGSTELHVNPF